MKYYLSPKGEIFAYELDGSQDHLIPEDFSAITDDEAASIRQQKTKEQFNALTYAEKRRAEYPSIGDQLDAFWKGGEEAEAMKLKILAVKAKYPKQ